MVSKFSNFPNGLSKNDELREYELNGADCIRINKSIFLEEVRSHLGTKGILLKHPVRC